MSKLKMVTQNGIFDTSLLCSSCPLSTSEGQPRWSKGKLGCGKPKYDPQGNISGFECIHPVTIVDESALTSCCNSQLDISVLITNFAKSENPSLDNLTSWLGDLFLEDSLLKAHISWNKEPYSWNRVIHTPTFDLIVCCWNKRQQTLLHSHDGNLAAIRVLSGKLLSRIYKLDDSCSKPSQIKNQQILEYNNISGVNDDEAHQLKALEQSVSIHIYSKPLSFITKYSSIMEEGNLQVVSF